VFHYKCSPTSITEERISAASLHLSKCQEVYTGDGSGKNVKEDKERLRADVLAAAESLATLEDLHRNAPASANKHRWAAEELLGLCRKNKGCYIKIGQHLANLDYLFPSEYTQTLQELYNDSPVSQYDEVRELVFQEVRRSEVASSSHRPES
jgi:predicted unusual protein kinase regulating ubiquinone biosynthesis (AarF/ABC1/UbiB family)